MQSLSAHLKLQGRSLWRIRRKTNPQTDRRRLIHHWMEPRGDYYYLPCYNLVIPLRMSDEDLMIGDDAVHGEEAYALLGDGEKYDPSKHDIYSDDTLHPNPSSGATQVV
ncbi:hypothetical protein SLA2020_382640 [Shorea laevis]